MCYECLSPEVRGASRDLDAKPFGTLKDGSMVHGNEAMADDTKFDGPSGQNEKFEGMKSDSTSDSKQLAASGRGN